MSITQTPLPGADAAALGIAAFVAVYAKGIWALVKHFPVMAHEGGHAITATIMGFGVRKVELKRNGDGLTRYRVPAVGGKGVLTGFAGTWPPVPSGWPQPGSSSSGSSSQSCGWPLSSS